MSGSRGATKNAREAPCSLRCLIFNSGSKQARVKSKQVRDQVRVGEGGCVCVGLGGGGGGGEGGRRCQCWHVADSERVSTNSKEHQGKSGGNRHAFVLSS